MPTHTIPKRWATGEARSAEDVRGAQTAIQIPIQPKCDHLPQFFRKEVEFEEARWLPEATRVGGPRRHMNLGLLLNPVLFLPGSSKLSLRHHPHRKGTASFTFFPVFSDPPKIQREETTAGKTLVVPFPLKATTVTGGSYIQFCSCAGVRERARVSAVRWQRTFPKLAGRCIIWGESCHFFFIGKRKRLFQSLFRHPMILENLQILIAVSQSELRGEDPEGERGRPWRRVGKPWRREGKTLKDTQEETGAGAEEWGCTQLRARPVVTKWALPGKHHPLALTNKRFQQTATEDLTRLSTADICSNMDEPWDHHTEWSRSDRGGIGVWHPLYAGSKKKLYKWTYLQNTKETHSLKE